MEDKSLNTKEFEELFQGILKLKNTKECKQFFRDLCTIAELEAMAERFQVAKKVSNQESYRDICKQTGSSTATITRVAHWLHHGMGGYGLVLKRLGVKTN
ncbi:MAG: YerC/YecD family TrpR-related protein [Candidatus Doudnabacteria bacterium]|jgi:TrpR-related protein YerC/YecD|nr:YerC/YecD family TrpR-related protein [Candidatus Doudnabacteria bacterium]